MCRLFGFRSVLKSQVHSSLVGAENALMLQSEEHPDGWGVSYYVAGSPHIVKSVETAIQDSLFKRVSGIVSSQTVLAHLRRATTGNVSIINTHPFQYGHWVFAHNGHIRDFAQHREAVTTMIHPTLRRFILGDTDSEHIFYLILTHLQAKLDIFADKIDQSALIQSVRESIDNLTDLVGPYCQVDSADLDQTYLSFLLCNGETLLAHQGGKKLYYSTYKTRCPERDTCDFYGPSCEAPSLDKVNHLIFSSEPLHGENVWIPMPPGQIIAVDSDMQIFFLQNSSAA